MRIAPQEDGVGEQRADVVEHRTARRLADRVPDRVLHPRVGGQDEQRRQHGAKRHEPDACQMHPLGEPVPSEEPQPEERRLEEERREAFHRERTAEHIADEPGVGRPVHPELELLHKTSDDADRDVDHEEVPEEPGQASILRVVGAVPHRLENRDEDGEPDRDGHEQEVIHARRRELSPSQVSIHATEPPSRRQLVRRRRTYAPVPSGASTSR